VLAQGQNDIRLQVSFFPLLSFFGFGISSAPMSGVTVRPCSHFLVVRFQRSRSGMVRLAGFWNRWVGQLDDATVENLGRLNRTSQQYRRMTPLERYRGCLVLAVGDAWARPAEIFWSSASLNLPRMAASCRR